MFSSDLGVNACSLEFRLGIWAWSVECRLGVQTRSLQSGLRSIVLGVLRVRCWSLLSTLWSPNLECGGRIWSTYLKSRVRTWNLDLKSGVQTWSLDFVSGIGVWTRFLTWGLNLLAVSSLDLGVWTPHWQSALQVWSPHLLKFGLEVWSPDMGVQTCSLECELKSLGILDYGVWKCENSSQ